MPTLMVIRHSLAKANEEGILMGAKLDSPLSEKGIMIARRKGQALKDRGFTPDKVFTSGLTRAKQTAAIILEELGLPLEPVRLADLNERDFGEHDGKPYKSVLDAFERYGDSPPTIEPTREFVARIMRAYEQIKAGTTGVTLVVTHSNPEMVMQAAALFPKTDLQKFWELGDPAYCEGFTYEF